MRTIKIDINQLNDIRTAHVYLKRRLGLPSYYGMNLDALYDCLSTMDETQVILTCEEDAQLTKTAGRFVRVMRDAAADNRRLVLSFDALAQEPRGRYRLIALDIDGTAVRDDKSMDELTRDAIRQALRVGKEVIFCTGRPVAETRQYLKLFPDMRYLLCESGALLYDLHKKTPVYRKCLADETVQALAQTAAGRDICPVAFIEGEYYIAGKQVDRLAHYRMGEFQEVVLQIAHPVDELFSHMKENGLRADKINLFHTTPEDRAISRKILEEMGVPICMADGEISSLECTAPGVSKGLGLEKLSQETGISTADMIVVGDADNDLVGLAAAGLAVAMGNASDRVKNVCDVVVADNEHCGCAEAICRYLLGTY